MFLDLARHRPAERKRLGWRAAPLEGQAIVIFALFSLVLIGMLALSVDAGFLLSERRQAQSAADAGALAAAKAAMDNKSSAEVVATGQGYGQFNAGANAVVTVNRPPTSGPYAGNAKYIEVAVAKPVTKFFVGAVYPGAWQVTARATAGIEPDGFNAALLALNSSAGGIKTAGSTTIKVVGGSVVSNYDINTSGSTSITADEYVAANDGFRTSGSTVIKGGKGENPAAPEIPDPLKDKISPPNLPSFPGNPVPSVTPPNGVCAQRPDWYPPPFINTFAPGTYSGGSGGCLKVTGSTQTSDTFRFTSGDYRLQNNAYIALLGFPKVILEGGRYNFVGGKGIEIGGSSPYVEIRAGQYSFLDGANLKIGGSSPDNQLCVGSTSAAGCTMYFTGGGGLITGGSNKITLYPGTYIFDGGPGLDMSGSDQLVFTGGEYRFWFRNGADLRFRGSSRITLSGAPYATMYFYGASGNSGWSDLDMSGSTSFNVPSGAYYFDRGRFLNSGSSTITGQNVFLYFKNGGYLESTGSATFGFTAPTSTIYPGYYPGVFMYSDAANTATFEWHGSTSSLSKGTIYLPSSPLKFGGSSNGKTIEGQVIADRFDTSGSTGLNVQFVEYVKTQVPKVYLVE